MKFSGKFASAAIFAAFGAAAMAVADIGPFSSIGQFARTSRSVGPATSGFQSAATSTLELRWPSSTKSALYVTGDIPVLSTVDVVAVLKVPGNTGRTEAEIFAGSQSIARFEFTGDDGTHQIDLSEFENGTSIVLRAEFRKVGSPGTTISKTEPLKLRVDTEGPRISDVRLANDPSSSLVKLKVRFSGDDLGSTASQKDYYKVNHIQPDGTKTEVDVKSAALTGQVVELTLEGPLKIGKHEVVAQTAVRDKFENPAGRVSLFKPIVRQIKSFTAVGPPTTGPAVHFPQFSQREQLDPNANFNPGDHIETRVVRLYYNRDAHRVAQIINRDIKQWNAAGVNRKREVAANARENTDTAERKRERLELEGINTAQELRKNERQADVAQAELADQQRDLNRAKQIITELRALERQTTAGPNLTLSNIKLTAATISNATLTGATVSQVQLSNTTTTNGMTMGGVTRNGTSNAAGTEISDGITEPTTQYPTSTTGGQVVGTEIVDGTVGGGVLTSGTILSATFEGGTITAGSVKGASVGLGNLAGGSIQAGTTTGGTTTGGVTNKGTKRGGIFNSATQTMAGGTTTGGTTTGGVYSDGTTRGATISDGTLVGVTIDGVTITGATVFAPNPNQPRIDQLKDELRQLTGSTETTIAALNEALTGAVTASENKLTEARSDVDASRQAVNVAKLDIADAESTEQIARRTQFESEVASGTADPDSYAPADLESFDPVMQVSISVVGEGVMQLRGPIRGINEIRTMINQIDSPLGQVKVGLFTVQINGEEGDKMDEVAARLEGYIDLSRFLTNQSLQLLRRAVQETAGQVAGQFDDHQYPQHRQIDRDRKYVYAFFGRDFVDELYEMDSEFLHTENKLLSIHAMDTVSLPQATFILALAKNSVREQIL